MSTLKDYIIENLDSINESIGAEKIASIFRNKRGKITSIFSDHIAREMQWDKMTDADVEEMSTEDARKLAYKRDSNAYIIWVDPAGEFLSRTIGNYTVWIPWTISSSIRNTVNAVSHAADKAFVVLEPDKFDTRDLRKFRTEQKNGAVALKDAAEVAKENIERYKSVLKEKKMNHFVIGDVAEQVGETIKKYAKLVEDVSMNLVSSDDYKETIYMFKSMEEDIQAITEFFSRVVSRNSEYNKIKDNLKNSPILDDFRSNVLREAGRLQKKIDEFNSKYIDSVE